MVKQNIVLKCLSLFLNITTRIIVKLCTHHYQYTLVFGTRRRLVSSISNKCSILIGLKLSIINEHYAIILYNKKKLFNIYL